MSSVNVICPHCEGGKDDDRVIVQQHWSKTYYTFICGHCKLEMDFIRDPHMNLQVQLMIVMGNYAMFAALEQLKEVEDRVGSMSEDELLQRLEELTKIKKGNWGKGDDDE